MSRIKVVPPYIHPGHLNFKYPAYLSSFTYGISVGKPRFPWRFLHHWAFRHELPNMSFLGNAGEAILMFVEPVSITFDTFPYYATHEVIPFIWDCWPCYFDKMEAWFNRHKTRMAIFTSRMEMEEMKRRCPQVNMLWCPEAVDGSLYKEGKALRDRSIDLLEFGRSNERILGHIDDSKINHVCTLVDGKFVYSNEQLFDAMGDAKITVCLPKSLTHPDVAQGIETLTQRYWEAMLSRMIIIGHAPQELIDVCGYNPVIELPSDGQPIDNLLQKILNNLDSYQQLVDKNRLIAIVHGLWNVRIKSVVDWLDNNGYSF